MRIDYDRAAAHYDDDPIRRKLPDPALLDLLHAIAAPRVLDVGCGTGSQQAANAAACPRARLVGLDPSGGMLAVARRKSAQIAWVRGCGEALPFAPASFDLVSCQFAYHHCANPRTLFAEARRVLAPGGRLALSNLCPHEMRASLIYHYFPAAWRIDEQHFLAPDQLERALRDAGFDAIESNLLRFDEAPGLADFLDQCRNRQWTSQLAAITDAEYAAGIAALERDVSRGGPAAEARGGGCLVSLLAAAR